MKENALLDKSKKFALRIIKLYKYLNENKREHILSKQLLRSGTSIGANLKEAAFAQSRADFQAKLFIAQKECAETEFWIEMMVGSHCIDNETAEQLLQEYGIVRRMLSKSIITAKNSNS